MLEINKHSENKHFSNLAFVALFICVILNVSCTQPPIFTFVRHFPEINPEGNFYDFIRAVRCDNEKIVTSMFSPKVFVYVQDKQKTQTELFTVLSQKLKQTVNLWTFTISFESFSYMYDSKGMFQNVKAYTEFTGILASKQTSEPEIEPDEPVINITWESSGNIWYIVSLSLNNQNLLILPKLSSE
jgi:hypothetical protein